MSIKLHYFDVNGIAEPIRYILHYAGVKFEDVRYDFKIWEKVKSSFTYGQVPMYEENGRILYQSTAIARYVATKADLVPSDPWEQAVLDAAVLNFVDFRNKFIPTYYEQDPQVKEQKTKLLFEETIDFYMSRFEKELKARNGFFGGKLSWADFVCVGNIEILNLYFDVEVEKDYPTVQALVQKIRSLPGVKEYIAARKPYVKPVFD